MRVRHIASVFVVFSLAFASICGTGPAPAAAAPRIDPQAVGLSAVTTMRASSAVQQADFTSLARAGFGTVRLSIEWPDVEPTPGVLDWSIPDQLVGNAAAAGLAILAVIGYAPSWAVPPEGQGYLHPAPADPARYANFVRLAADRYKSSIGTWEIWNEPNIQAGFAPRPDPVKYADMLRRSFWAIKSVDPRATVLTGGTAPALDDGTNMSPAGFLGRVYAAGARGSFDAVAMHPYNAPQLLSQASEPWSSRNAIAAVTVLMRNAGDGNKRIWCTEFGASSLAGTPYGVTEERQAEILTDGINYFRSLRNGGPFIIFDYRDLNSASPDPEYHFGLLHTDYSPKPALAAVQGLVRR